MVGQDPPIRQAVDQGRLIGETVGGRQGCGAYGQGTLAVWQLICLLMPGPVLMAKRQILCSPDLVGKVTVKPWLGP